VSLLQAIMLWLIWSAMMGLGQFIYDYQTLIVGAGAIGAAYVAAKPVWRQLELTQTQANGVLREMLLQRQAELKKAQEASTEKVGKIVNDLADGVEVDGHILRISEHDAHHFDMGTLMGEEAISLSYSARFEITGLPPFSAGGIRDIESDPLRTGEASSAPLARVHVYGCCDRCVSGCFLAPALHCQLWQLPRLKVAKNAPDHVTLVNLRRRSAGHSRKAFRDELDDLVRGVARGADDPHPALVGPDLRLEIGRVAAHPRGRVHHARGFDLLGMVEDIVPEVEDSEGRHDDATHLSYPRSFAADSSQKSVGFLT
jgi:hypothetical protein